MLPAYLGIGSDDSRIELHLLRQWSNLFMAMRPFIGGHCACLPQQEEMRNLKTSAAPVVSAGTDARNAEQGKRRRRRQSLGEQG